MPDPCGYKIKGEIGVRGKGSRNLYTSSLELILPGHLAVRWQGLKEIKDIYK